MGDLLFNRDMSGLRRFLFLACLLISACYSWAQEGAPLLSQYKESSEIENQSWGICQDENNMMMFANRRGILTFDGQAWNFIRIPVIPYSIRYNRNDKRVYVGSENNYGYLKRDEKGFYRFISLLQGDSSRVGIITRIIFSDSTVYFYSEDYISRHNLRTGKLEMRMGRKENLPFTGMFVTPRNTFINVLAKGLYRLESDTLFPIVTGYLLENEEVLFSLPYDEKMVLLGLGDGRLSLFDGIKFYNYQIRDEGYLSQNILSEGILISDSLYAFATLEGGAIVVEKRSGKLRHTINYLNGLPDDEVFALGRDNNNGLWISHQYGLTRAELILPVENYSIYPGLKGNLIQALWYNNELYVGTSEGVFYLTEVKKYTEVEILVRQDQVPVKASESQAGKQAGQLELAQVQKPVQEVQKTRRNIFSKIFGKKTETTIRPEKPVETAAPVSPQAAAGQKARPAPVYVRKTVSRLKSINYEFKKVEGMDEKSKQLVPTGQGILVSTNKGLYSITGHKAQAVVTDRYINSVSSITDDNRYYIATSEGYFYVTYSGGKWIPSFPDPKFIMPLYSIARAGEKTLWAGSDDAAVRIILSDKPEYCIYGVKSEYPQRCIVDYVNDTLFMFAETGVSYYSPDADSLVSYGEQFTSNRIRIEYVTSQPGAPWIKDANEWLFLNGQIGMSSDDRAILKLFEKIISIYTDRNNLWIIDGGNQLYRIMRNRIQSFRPELGIFIRSITNEEGVYFKLSDIVFGRGDNTVYFDLVAPGYYKRNSVQYQYIVDKMMDDWSKWSTSSTINLMLPHGTYTLRVRAKDLWGNISETKSLVFTIKTPFTQTSFFYVLSALLLLMVIIIVVRFRERQLQKEKRILEEKVRERTAEIEAQKEEITSSIEYASRIQMAMLPMEELFGNIFPEYFVIFRPRDIVSGDFYWVAEDMNHIYFTVADCTGHGVPGAFMSTLGISTLNEIITNRVDLHANTVLNLLREKIKKSLHQTGKEGEAADGMDVSFCILHKDRKTLEYSGAYNPLIIVQGGETKEYKADRMPIGIYIGEKESFTNYEINVSPGDTIYIFSDGFTDQFGGPEGAKYKKANLKKLISEIWSKPMKEQKRIFEEEFEKWKNKADQIDDVTIIGIRI
jgi:serine phosphatase RsbU (regulator of sigma subunit)